MEQPLEVGPHEDGDDDGHDGESDNPEEDVRVGLDGPHGLEVHSLWGDVSESGVADRKRETYEVTGEQGQREEDDSRKREPAHDLVHLVRRHLRATMSNVPVSETS